MSIKGFGCLPFSDLQTSVSQSQSQSQSHHHDMIMYKNQGEGEEDKGYCSSLGFMDLLGMQLQQASYSTLFDDIPLTKMEEESSFIEVLSHHYPPPTTPTNSSSISSANSCDRVFNNHDHVKVADEQEEQLQQQQQQQKTKNVLKGKKTNQKRQREQRFAFMTKSEVDHLEDGYRWRKYGQKAVKNSPFPRSYYRCTTISCNVKKRVERSFNDPTIVVTTYEGQHTHHSPVMTRPHHLVGASLPNSGLAGLLSNYQQQQPQHDHHHQQQQQQRPSVSYSALGGRFVYEDHGLLQDIVSSHMLKEE